MSLFFKLDLTFIYIYIYNNSRPNTDICLFFVFSGRCVCATSWPWLMETSSWWRPETSTASRTGTLWSVTENFHLESKTKLCSWNLNFRFWKKRWKKRCETTSGVDLHEVHDHHHKQISIFTEIWQFFFFFILKVIVITFYLILVFSIMGWCVFCVGDCCLLLRVRTRAQFDGTVFLSTSVFVACRLNFVFICCYSHVDVQNS